MLPCASDTDLSSETFAHFEQLSQSVLVTDSVLSAPGPRVLYANPAFERMTGWPREQIVGRTPRVLQGPETEQHLMDELKVALQRGENWCGETTNYRRNGTPFIMKWTIAPVRDAAGSVQRFVAIQENVTRIRQRQLHEGHLNAVIQQLMSVAAEGILVLDADQRITDIGGGTEQIFGWRKSELIGQPLSTLIPERFRAIHAGHVQAFALGGEKVRPMAQRDDVTAQHHDGSEIPVMISIAKLGNAGNQGFVAVVQDLSARKEQERKLSESEQRYRAVFNLSYQFVALLTADGKVLEANQSALEFFSGGISEVLGKDFSETPWFIDSPDVRKKVRTALTAAAAGGCVRGQTVLKAPDGTLRTFEYSIRPVFDAEGNVEYLIPEGHDITDLIQSTEALKNRERQLKEAQRIAKVGDWHWDIASGQLFWSDQTYRIFGMNADATPTYERFLSSVLAEDRDKVESAVNAALAGKAAYALHHRIVLSDGSERVVHEQAEVNSDDEGRPIEMVGIVQDITESKKMEAVLIAAKRDAETANEAKSRFLSMIGHELRTPLNAVNGFSQLIAEETFGPVGSPQYLEYAQLIQKSGDHLLDVINVLLDTTRVESGRMDIAADWFAATAFLQQTVDLARVECGKPSVQVLLETPPTAKLFADRRLLRQALLNLIGNAVKFSPAHGTVAVIGRVAPEGAYEITVRDEGPGIPADAILHVTLPFFQVDDSLSRRQEGLGLGLYLAKSFLEMHDGDLRLQSPPEGGTLATLKIPSDRVDLAEAIEYATSQVP